MRLAFVILLVLTLPAVAQPQPPPPDPRPWAEGIPEEKQALALAAYEAGNADYAEDRFAQALAKYREAIAHWDHPAIQFNMAVCLINLDRPIEAREAIERALAYGAAPLGPDLHQQALTYRKLLDGRLTRVTIRCDEPGAEVTLDGAALFTAPGAITRWIEPGKHQLVATKAGYLTASDTLALAPGTTEQIDVKLYAFISTTRTTRRWDVWRPYAFVGAGALVAGIGGVTYALASRDYNRYDERIRLACPRGCTAEETAALDDERSIKARADSEKTAAISLLFVGGALAVAGGVGLYLNQPRTEVIAPAATPVIYSRPGGAVLGVDVRF